MIKLHSNLNNNDIPNRFIISSGASGSIIKDLNLIDTQTWIYNVNNLYLENITMTFKNIGTGSEMIPVSIRYCNNITLDKCYIFSENTETTLGLFVTSNTTLINSIIVGQGSNVGSLISLECPNEVYDKPYDDYVIRSTNNTIKNCTIQTGNPEAIPIESSADADYTTIDGIKVYANQNIRTGYFATVTNSKFYNASGINLNANSVAYNNIIKGSSSQIGNNAKVYNNTFKTLTISNGNIIFENNTVEKLTITTPINLKYNILYDLTLNSNSKFSNITNNTITGIIKF